jgi:hypothetical protein
MAAPQREWGTSIQPFKKPVANHSPVILKSFIVTNFKICRIFHHHLQLTEQFTESHAAS